MFPRNFLNSAVVNVLILVSLSHNAMANTTAEFQQAKQEFRLAKDEKQIELNAEKFKQQLQQNPGQALLMLYSGAATSKLAMTTILPWKKLSFAEDGLATIDKALHLFASQKHDVAAEIEAKFVAANTFLAVPEFMNRKQRGQQLLEELANHQALNSVEPNLAASILLKAAQQATSTKNFTLARHYLNQILNTQNALQPQAQAMLKGLPS